MASKVPKNMGRRASGEEITNKNKHASPVSSQTPLGSRWDFRQKVSVTQIKTDLQPTKVELLHTELSGLMLMGSEHLVLKAMTAKLVPKQQVLKLIRAQKQNTQQQF